MKISSLHSNRGAHNWLIYDVGDCWLERNVDFYRGVTYDLGCGEAPYKEWFLQYVDQYIGVDWSNSLHDIKADIVANLNEPLPIEDHVADTVLSFSVLEHLCEPQLMLNEAHRIMKLGGTLVLQVPWQWWIHEAPYDFYRYTPHALQLLLSRAGFSEINVHAQSGIFTMLIMKLNYFSLRLIRGPKATRYLVQILLIVFWFLGQKLAVLLDKLDSSWELETIGFFVTAKKFS